MKATPPPAAEKLEMMQASMGCLIFGLLGLLPIIGGPFALAALWFSGQATPLEKCFWNPAKPHRILGVCCAALGAIVWGFIDLLLLFRAAETFI